MSDRKLQQIDRRIADTLEELRILRVQADQAHEETMAALRDADRRSEDRWTADRERDRERDLQRDREDREERGRREAEWAEIIEQGERRGDELRALRQISDMKLAELREVSATNRIQTDALRLVLERIEAQDRGRG